MHARGSRACVSLDYAEIAADKLHLGLISLFFPPHLLCFDANARLNFGCLGCKEEKPIGSPMYVCIGLYGFEWRSFWTGIGNQREQKAAQHCGSQYGILLVYLRDLSCAKLLPVVCLGVFVRWLLPKVPCSGLQRWPWEDVRPGRFAQFVYFGVKNQVFMSSKGCSKARNHCQTVKTENVKVSLDNRPLADGLRAASHNRMRRKT